MEGLLDGMETETQETTNTETMNTETAGGTPAPEQKTETAVPSDWKSGLPEELRGSVEKFKTVEDMAKSYLNMEKLVGKKTIGMPDENSSEEEWSKLYDRLGRPVAADKYEVKRAEGLPPELIDEEGMKSFLGAAYKAGLNQKQVSALVSEFDRQLLEGAKRSAAAEEARKGEAVSELRKLWGSDLQEKVERAQQTLNILDPHETIDREKLRNNVQVIQLLSSFSDKVLGDTLPKGTDGGSISDIEDRLAVLMSSPAFANEMSLDHDKIMTEYKMLMQKRSALRRR
ncbi:MAG: hypothetical protein SPK75_15270 [Victivallales bacterium]|nr:hypothetical protein [Victivallales bacterium]